MFGNRSRLFKVVILAAAFLALPCSMLAQRGAGGGRTGGGLAGGGGLSGGGSGPDSGLDVKDDLKGFHEALALQATSQQVVEFKLMIASTENASAELRIFLDHATAENNAADLASRDKTLVQALGQARAANNKFLEKLSDHQKAGLKETIKRLSKAESDLAQQAKALDLQVEEAKSGGPQIAGPAQALQRTLETFHIEQLGLGDEMSIGAAGSQVFAFNIPPVKSSISFARQPVAIITSGVISKAAQLAAPNNFHLELTSDMSDLQQNITEVLRSQLDKLDSCGEQVGIRRAFLSALSPSSVAQVQLHYERWACFGKGNSTEMMEGDGTIEVKLTPEIAEDGTFRLIPVIARVDAQGSVGEQLRSGSLGEVIRDKIAETILSVIRLSSDYKTVLPATTQGNVTLRRARFDGSGAGNLSLIIEGNLLLSSAQAVALAGDSNAGGQKGQASAAQTTPQ
jgi:hypothetical protein